MMAGMADPLTLGVVGATALTEGVKFLYEQASELLARWRERHETELEPVEIEAPPGLLAGGVGRARIDESALTLLESDIRDLHTFLAPYAAADQPVSRLDDKVVAMADALRRSLEAVYGRRITFAGEPRPPSGPVVTGEIKAAEISGYVAGVRARVVKSGDVRGSVVTDQVAPGASAFGVDVDSIG